MINFFSSLLDTPREFMVQFQDTATPVMSAISDLHSYVLFYIIIIFVFVAFLIYDVLKFFRIDKNISFFSTPPKLDKEIANDPFFLSKFVVKKKLIHENAFFSLFLNNLFFNNLLRLSLNVRLFKFTHQTLLETIWTIIPVVIIISIAIPSFLLLYAIDVNVDTALTIKAIGHQWYWSYELEYPVLSAEYRLRFKRRIFDSYMIQAEELKIGQLRNLEVDHAVVLPIKTHLDLIVTADDVLHSFAVPSLGVKVDAVPGRLNHTNLFIERPGIFYGQCSELCGTNHGFMPIKALGVKYINYVYIHNKNISL